jgi:hypothetical protein
MDFRIRWIGVEIRPLPSGNYSSWGDLLNLSQPQSHHLTNMIPYRKAVRVTENKVFRFLVNTSSVLSLYLSTIKVLTILGNRNCVILISITLLPNTISDIKKVFNGSLLN